MREVQDWSGGTRISACLQEFNRRCARSTLNSRATVLLISDGLEHGGPDDPGCQTLRFEMELLHKSCRRLVWLNPLLRFDAFQPRAAGIQAMLPHVDLFLPATWTAWRASPGCWRASGLRLQAPGASAEDRGVDLLYSPPRTAPVRSRTQPHRAPETSVE